MPAGRSIPWDIYEEHLDEAAFLWGQWESALDAPNYALPDVIVGPEERLRAHLDGLVLGGAPVAEKLLLPALGDEDAGKVAAAAWALLQGEDADHLDGVFDALTKAEKKEVRAALGRAFELSLRADLVTRVTPLFAASSPSTQAVILNVVSARGAMSTLPPLETLLVTRHPELLAAALRALSRTPHPEQARLVEPALSSAYVAIREAAIEAGMMLGMRAAWQACNKLVARNASGSKLAMALLALGGEAADLNTVIKKLTVKTMQRDALWALGFSGTVEAADAVLELVDDEELAKLVGEAFTTITGAPIFGALAKVGETDNTSPPEVIEDDDAPLPVLKPEDGLPVPNGERLRAWWEKTKGQFSPGARYIYGQPATPETLHLALEQGPTWRRRVWSLEVAVRGGIAPRGGGWGSDEKKAAQAFPAGMRVDRRLTELARV